MPISEEKKEHEYLKYIALQNNHLKRCSSELGYDPNAHLVMNNSVNHRLYHTKGSQKLNTDIIDMYQLDNFLEQGECERIIEISKKNLVPATLASIGRSYDRTNSTCFFTAGETSTEDFEFAKMINNKICKAMGIDPSYAEPMQAQRYNVGEEFKPHTDYFSNREYLEHCNIQGNRTWTFMIYLNDVEDGGKTNMCNCHAKFRAKMGRAVTWNNLDREGKGNNNTLHAGEPVLKGTKYIITKWFRQMPMSLGEKQRLVSWDGI